MTKIEQAIKFSIEGGYNNEYYRDLALGNPHFEEVILLDKNFWICLGKGAKWLEPKLVTRGNWDDMESMSTEAMPHWLYHWHSFIDALIRDETPESFFAELLLDK